MEWTDLAGQDTEIIYQIMCGGEAEIEIEMKYLRIQCLDTVTTSVMKPTTTWMTEICDLVMDSEQETGNILLTLLNSDVLQNVTTTLVMTPTTTHLSTHLTTTILLLLLLLMHTDTVHLLLTVITMQITRTSLLEEENGRKMMAVVTHHQ